jgi:hypothetical protein
MPTDRWNVELDDPGRRYYPTSVMLSGLGLDDHNHSLLMDLAESILDGDGRAEAWADFIVALGNLRTDSSEAAQDAMADAWDALATELPSALRMPLPEARYVAHLLDEAAGRVGIEAP